VPDINTKYRMTALPGSNMFRDEDLDYTARGVLGYLSTQISRDGYPTVTADTIPRGGIGRQKILSILELLASRGYVEVVE
jgi:hypothetical protein